MMVLALMLIAVVSSTSASPAVIYKLADIYELIWTDRGSGGNNDVSIWRPVNGQSQFCSLGDIANSHYSKPHVKAVLVKRSAAVIPPNGFYKIWSDAGSGADTDVTIYRMRAPSGYTCLGDVAMPSHNIIPNVNRYCCVKTKYVVRGGITQVYSDHGSGADADGSFWRVVRSGNNGLGGGNFIAVHGYSRPSHGFVLQKSSNVVEV